MNAEPLRLLLTGYLVAMSVLALLYLRRRPLTWIQFTAWGLLSLLVPALGPFLVILARPGKPNRAWTGTDQHGSFRVLRVDLRPISRKRADTLRARRKR